MRKTRSGKENIVPAGVMALGKSNSYSNMHSGKHTEDENAGITTTMAESRKLREARVLRKHILNR